jgi:hypothetical protein
MAVSVWRRVENTYSVVMPAKAGASSTPRPLRVTHERLGVLGPPVKPGDDSGVVV